MYKIIPWSSKLDLDEFYKTAKEKGFENNASQQMLVDCFQKEREKQVWILYHNDYAVGSVAAHSLDLFEEKSYRICVRTCVFTDKLPILTLRSRKRTIQQHQNITAQFFIPTCIEWAGKDSTLYISTNESPVGSQRLVHTIYCPALAETGALIKQHELMYRGHVQTFWKLNSKIFLEQLSQFPRW